MGGRRRERGRTRYLVSSLLRGKASVSSRCNASKKQSEQQPPVDVEIPALVFIPSGTLGSIELRTHSLRSHRQLFPYGCKLFEWPHPPPKLGRLTQRQPLRRFQLGLEPPKDPFRLARDYISLPSRRTNLAREPLQGSYLEGTHVCNLRRSLWLPLSHSDFLSLDCFLACTRLPAALVFVLLRRPEMSGLLGSSVYCAPTIAI